MNAIRRILTIASAIMILSLSPSFAQDIDTSIPGMRSPEDLAVWFSKEFSYQITLPDRPHSPKETLESRRGDCDDLALLASEMLTRMGVQNDVIIIRFKKLKVAHAICIWKDNNGFYDFISNLEFCRTGKKDMDSAIRRFYPDCENIIPLHVHAEITG